MARSLLQQFTQNRGSIVYDDTLSTALAELAGRSKTAGLTLTVSGTTATITAGGNFSDADEGNILMIGGAAYEITAVSSTTECTVDSAPGDGSSISANLHYYQNLEDDLNYIRSRLKEITGETTWSGANSDTLISLRDAITGADSFLELNDVEVGSYTDGNMLYTTTTGVNDTAIVKFEPITGTFYVTDNGTLFPTDGFSFGAYDGGGLSVSFGGEGLLYLDAEGFQTGEATLKPAYFEVDITNKDIELHAHNNVTTTISGTDQLTVDANGISLASGESVNNIVASITEPGSDDNLVTEQGIVEFVTAVSGVLNSSIVGQDEFIELSDVYVDSYAADNMLYTSSSGVHDTSDMTYDPDTGDIRIGGTSAPRFVTDVAAATAIMYGDNDTFIAISGTAGSFAAYDNSTLIFSMTDTVQSLGVTSDTYMTVDQDNDDIEFGAGGTAEVTISTAGLALKSGADVNNIVTEITAGGSDDNLATEQAIVEYINTVSGSMVHNELEGLQGGTADQYYHLTSNEEGAFSSDGSTFTFTQNLAGTTLDLSSTLDVAGAADFTNNVAVSGTLDVDGAVDLDSTLNVQGAVTLQNNLTVNGTFGFDIGTTVTEISTSTAGPGDDDTLLTAAAIHSIVGALEHNDLQGLQGGAPDEYYHLDAATYSGIFSNSPTLGIGEYAGTNIEVDYGTANDITMEISGIQQMYIDSTGVTLASGTNVDHVKTEIAEPGSDDALVTEQAIVEYVAAERDEHAIWEIVDTPTDQIRPKVAYLDYAIYTEGNVTIGGDLTVTGTLFYTNTETVQVSDNLIVINYGESGAGVTAGEAGIQVDRGSETDYQFLFDEGTDTFRIGVSGTQSSFNVAPLQPVATREDTPTDTRVAWWDADDYTFRTHGDAYITVNSGTDTLVFAVADTTEMTVSTAGLSLKTGESVNNIVASITELGSDDNLVTEQAVVEYVTSVSGVLQTDIDNLESYVNTVSGSLQSDIDALESEFDSHNHSHNSLTDLQGGTTNQYYHLTSNEYTAFSSDGSTWTFSQAMALATGTSVNEIVDSTGNLDGSSTDDQLATAKLIYNELQELTTGSGQVDHNLLSGLQGGAPDEYYHMSAADYGSISNWDEAYSWGDHAEAGYITSWGPETDPVFGASPAAGITASGISQWDTAYGWGDHSVVGYLLEATWTTGSGALQDQIDDNTTDLGTITGYVHDHYDMDLTYSGSNVWTLTDASIDGAVPDDLKVYLNGLKNRANDEDYYSTSVNGNKLTITFAYDTYETDWANVEYTVNIY